MANPEQLGKGGALVSFKKVLTGVGRSIGIVSKQMKQVEKVSAVYSSRLEKVTKAEQSLANYRKKFAIEWFDKKKKESEALEKDGYHTKESLDVLKERREEYERYIDTTSGVMSSQVKQLLLFDETRTALEDRLGTEQRLLRSTKKSIKSTDEESGGRVKWLRGIYTQSKLNVKTFAQTRNVLQKLRTTWRFLGIAATGAMAYIMSASPHLRAEMTLMKVEIDKVARVMGKSMQPAFKAVREKGLEPLVDAFLGLDKQMQDTISWILLLVLVLEGLALAIVAVKATLIGKGLIWAFGKLSVALGVGTTGTIAVILLFAGLIVMLLWAKDVYGFLEEKVDSTTGATWGLWFALLSLAHGFEFTANVIMIVVLSIVALAIGIVGIIVVLGALLLILISGVLRLLTFSDAADSVAGAADTILVAWEKLMDWIADVFMVYWHKVFGNSEFVDAIESAYDKMKVWIDKIIEPFQDVIKWITDTLMIFWNKIFGNSEFSDAIESAYDKMKIWVDKMIEPFQALIDWIDLTFVPFFDTLWDKITSVFTDEGGIFAGIVAIGTGILNTFSDLAEAKINLPFNAIDDFLSEIKDVKISISKWVTLEPFKWVSSFGQNIVDLPSFAKGSPFVPDTGLAMLHRGEMVIPATQASTIRLGKSSKIINLNPVFNFTISGQNLDENEIVRKVSERTLDEIQRLVSTV